MLEGLLPHWMLRAPGSGAGFQVRFQGSTGVVPTFCWPCLWKEWSITHGEEVRGTEMRKRDRDIKGPMTASVGAWWVKKIKRTLSVHM